MRGPRLHARLLARGAAGHLPAVTARFRGYGLLSLPLESGDVIAFRHFAASSLGPPFNFLWHRTPAGRWSCSVDVAPHRSCYPFFEPAVEAVHVGEISVRWRGGCEVCICAAATRLSIVVRLASTPATRMWHGVTALLPPPVWHSQWWLRALGHAAGLALRARPLVLAGRAPAGSEYRMRPAALWRVTAGAAVLAGRDLGDVTRAPQPVLLGGLELPDRALVAALTEDYCAQDGIAKAEE